MIPYIIYKPNKNSLILMGNLNKIQIPNDNVPLSLAYK